MASDEWEIFKKKVSPLKEKRKSIRIPKKNSEIKEGVRENLSNDVFEKLEIKVSDDWGNLEKNTLKRILKGKIKICSSLDLHGNTIEEAKRLVFEFLECNYKKQNRLLLIISGKGQRFSVADGWKGVGEIKKNLPTWLNSLALSNKVLWFDHAPPDKGGKGAFLVYLKKSTR
jgi:DNA-nicking Smr family endonuclease